LVTRAADAARISPDYADITIPPNIAPLNFKILNSGAGYRIRVEGDRGKPFAASTSQGSVLLPLARWKALVAENAGHLIYFRISVRDEAGACSELQPITNRVSPERIDSHLVYRLIGPVFNMYREMGIYQRDLESFRETPILRNSKFNDGCVNCHTFRENDSGAMALHIRDKASGNPMLLARSNQVAKIAKTAGYMAWHPSGRLLAFSANKLTMFFHSTGEARDVFDSNSDLGIYRVDNNTVENPQAISDPNLLETWPAWSSDGKWLYFCRASKLPIERFRQVRYDLVRVAYDGEKHSWGEPEVLISARELGLSVAQPRASPDSSAVLVCLSKYGSFPVYQPSSDLYSLELSARELNKLEINSDRTDSWPCWSNSGRWLVFSSKRRDGLFSRPYFSYVDKQGHFRKPFILPQERPDFYDSFLKNYNRPELITGEVQVMESALAEAVLKPRLVLSPQSAAGSDRNLPETGSGEPEYIKAHE
jgi:hypothetical protein